MEGKVENDKYKHSLLLGILRKFQGETPEIVLRWDEKKMLEKLKARVSESYYSKGIIKRPRHVTEFLGHLEIAWGNFIKELDDETQNTTF